MKQIQGDLLSLISRTRKPPTDALNNYNFNLRQIVPHQSLTTTNLNALNDGFGAVLTSASASPPVVDSLKSSLYQFASQVDTNSPQPVNLATNDYTLVLQTALAIGRPMPAPILPKIAKNQGIQANVDHIKTPLRHPSFVGTYHFHTHIQIITPSGEVVGTVNCRKNNKYKVTVEPALSPGIYQFRIRAYDDAGNLSHVSRLFAVKVVPKRHHHSK
ncbi:MAG: Ig-like domain-containing protein [Isosphaeraceae bacterium]